MDIELDRISHVRAAAMVVDALQGKLAIRKYDLQVVGPQEDCG